MSDSDPGGWREHRYIILGIIILVLTLLFLIAGEASAQDAYLWVEPQIAAEKDGEHFTTVSVGKQWSSKIGIFAQSSHGNYWGETVFGPSFQFGERLGFGAGLGVEHYNPKKLRLRLTGYYEEPRSGSFVDIQFDTGWRQYSWIWVDAVQMYGWFGVGGLVQMPGGGAGMKVELRPNDLFAIWFSPVYDWQANEVRPLIGLRLMLNSAQ